jgi:recombination protein RecA
MSQALRKLSGAIKTSNTAMVFTNQLRQKIGVLYGNPETTSGGMALKFYASVRLDMRHTQAIKDGGEVIGNRVLVKVKKNKVAPPFRECEFDVMYDEGISKEGDVLDLGVRLGLVEKRGSFYLYGDERLGQGRESAKQALREQPVLCLKIENAIRRHRGIAELDAAPALEFDVDGQLETEPDRQAASAR